jgi:hypothetical protein
VSRSKDGENAVATAVDHGQFTRAMEAGIKALGFANYFEIKG